MRRPFLSFAALYLFILLMLTSQLMASETRPNILFVLFDDLGSVDLGCYGHPQVQSPHIDSLAGEGARFSAFYVSSPKCSPSRAGMLTGRSNQRMGFSDWIRRGSGDHMRAEEVTIATLLRDSGYDTMLSGKWHLNSKWLSPEEPQPDDHGFDYYYGLHNIPWTEGDHKGKLTHENPADFVRNGEALGPLTGWDMDLLVDETIGWLQGTTTPARDTSAPFFIYLSIPTPHSPFEAAPEYENLYSGMSSDSRGYYGLITQSDAALGRLFAEMKRLGIFDDTLIVVTSDNGHPGPGSSGQYRGQKNHVTEGGIRLPFIVRHPSTVAPNVVIDETICGYDILPSFASMAGIDLEAALPAGRVLDGQDITPLFAGESITRARPVYVHYDGIGPDKKRALRDGKWKILTDQGLNNFEFYHIERDPGEASDRQSSDPVEFDRVKNLVIDYNTETLNDPLHP
jgi:arylsulfatase A